MDISQIPPDQFKPVVCVRCGNPIFIVKVIMQYYKGFMTKTPVLREVPQRQCDNCGQVFDSKNIHTVDSVDAIKIINLGAKKEDSSQLKIEL